MNIGSMSNNYIIPYSGVSRVTPVNADNTVDTSTKVKPVECQTCKNREYVDGSNEPDVSFKTPGKIAAGESYAKVSAHGKCDSEKQQAGREADIGECNIEDGGLSGMRQNVCCRWRDDDTDPVFRE